MLVSTSDVLAKKHESLATTKEIMDSLRERFRQPSGSLKHESIKHIYTEQMKENTSFSEHVLDMMIHFNNDEVNGYPIDEANIKSFILQSLSKSIVLYQINGSLNKIKFTIATLPNELQRFQNLTMGKVKEVEANVARADKVFMKGSSSKTKVGPSLMKIKGKGKTSKNSKRKNIAKGKCYHSNNNRHWLRNYPQYLVEKKAEKIA